MEPVIELRGTRYSLVEAFEAYLLCIQVVESGAAALKATHRPDVMLSIAQSIIQNACDARALHGALSTCWRKGASH